MLTCVTGISCHNSGPCCFRAWLAKAWPKGWIWGSTESFPSVTSSYSSKTPWAQKLEEQCTIVATRESSWSGDMQSSGALGLRVLIVLENAFLCTAVTTWSSAVLGDSSRRPPTASIFAKKCHHSLLAQDFLLLLQQLKLQNDPAGVLQRNPSTELKVLVILTILLIELIYCILYCR